MSIKVHSFLDPKEVKQLIDDGYLTERYHPKFNLAILNYTDKTTYDRKWNDITLQCRGLIFNYLTGEVKARPFPKIFNHNEPDAPTIPLDASVRVTDKIDGSLGIMYITEDGYAIATRGSFTSEQAIRGTEILEKVYPDRTFFPGGYTHLFEIVYPENRIVLDYGETEALFYLGSINNETGHRGDILSWPHRPAVFSFPTFADALSAPPREQAEGVVIESFYGTVKMKQQDYVELHRIIFGLNARAVWRVLSDPEQSYSDFELMLPEEFVEWAALTANKLLVEKRQWIEDAYSTFNNIDRFLGGNYTRKEFAQEAVKGGEPAPLFMILDGNGDRVEEWAWKKVYPDAGWSPRSLPEGEAE